MKPSKLDANQVARVLKVALYVAISSFLGSLIAATTSQPEMFGVYTIMINTGLVFLKQLVTPTGN